MRISVHGERAAGRCAFCHGDLAFARVERTGCRAAYHADCTDRCIALGCREGCLVPLNAIDRAPVQDDPAGLTAAMVLATCGLPAAFAFAIAVPGPGTFAVLALNAFCWVAVYVVLAAHRGRAERRTSRAARARPVRVTAALRAPAPAEGAVRLPDIFAPRPIVVGDRSSSIEERSHQREALLDRRPPGLGRTI